MKWVTVLNMFALSNKSRFWLGRHTCTFFDNVCFEHAELIIASVFITLVDI
jgi:hypothetical protein